jgi:hypothetical protein
MQKGNNTSKTDNNQFYPPYNYSIKKMGGVNFQTMEGIVDSGAHSRNAGFVTSQAVGFSSNNGTATWI